MCSSPPRCHVVNDCTCFLRVVGRGMRNMVPLAHSLTQILEWELIYPSFAMLCFKKPVCYVYI